MNLDAPTRARLPADALVSLADQRARPDLEVLRDGDILWLRWRLDGTAIVLRLLPLPGVELFETRDGQWFPAGRLLPVAGVPDDNRPGWRHLSALLFPARIEPHREVESAWNATPLSLVPGPTPRPATALRADLDVVLAWANTATSADLARQRAVWTTTEILLVGDALPALVPACRYHGQRVLLPLGYVTSPALTETALIEIHRLRPGEIALLRDDGVEIVEEGRFAPLTRAALRRAALQRSGV